MGAVLILGSESKQGLVAIQTLSKKGLHVTAGSPLRWGPGSLSKYADRHITYPWPEEDPDVFTQIVERELKQGEYDMLLPIDETTVETVVRQKSRFEEHTTVPFLPYEHLKVGLNKHRTIEAADKFDVPYPKTVSHEENDFESIIDILGYPVVVKSVRGSGRKGVSVCNSRDELEQATHQIRTTHGPVLYQEYIPNGGERGVYTLYDHSGKLTAVTVQQRLRSNPPEGGASTYRETVEDPELVALTDEFLKLLNWQGLAMAEFRIDPRTNTPKLLEINPRLWGSLALSVYAGVDFPYLLYQIATGESVDSNLDYEVGVRARCLFTDFLQVFARENRARAFIEFLQPSSKPCHYDIVSRHDPFPTVGYFAYGFKVLFDRWRQGVIDFKDR